MPNGEYDTTTSATPINFISSSGQWQAINNNLVADSSPNYGAQNGANSYKVEFPSTLGAAPVKVSVGSAWIGMSLDGASAPLTTSGSTAAYANALPGVNVSYQAEGNGSHEFLSLANSSVPTSYNFAVTASSGISLTSLLSGGLAIASGSNQVGVIDAPTVTDADGVTGQATMTAVPTATGWTVTVAIDPAWLADSTRAFPVVIDPDVTMSATSLCTINSLAPTIYQYCGDADADQDNNGTNTQLENGLVQFGLTSIPFDSQVTEATLTLGGSENSSVDNGANTGTLTVRSLGQAYSASSVTWDNASSTTAWHTAGGTVATTPSSAIYNVADPGNDATSWTYYPTQLTQDWISGQANNGAGAPNDGFVLSETTPVTTLTGIDIDITSATLKVTG